MKNIINVFNATLGYDHASHRPITLEKKVWIICLKSNSVYLRQSAKKIIYKILMFIKCELIHIQVFI